MATALKTPPILSDDIPYSDWKNDVNIWKLYTDLDKKKRGPALYLTLTGKARECVRSLKAEEIGGDNGLDLIVNKLNAVFEDDINMQTFTCFQEFYQYRRPSGVGMKEFIIRYEGLYHRLGTFDIKLPEGVQAFFLLTAANISDDHEKLARATCAEMRYDSMKKTILKIYSDPAADNQDEVAPSVKTETVCYSGQSQRGGYRGRGRGSYIPRYSRSESGENPKDSDGKVMVCFKCKSTKHFARYCDKSYNNENNSSSKIKKKERVQIVLLLVAVTTR